MRRALILLLAACILFAADDPWAKVRNLKTDTEVRIFKIGSTKPLLGKLDEVHDDSLIVVLKNEEIAIPKDQIDRLDYRPPQTGNRVTKSTTTTVDDPTSKPSPPKPTSESAAPGSSSSTSLSFGSKPDFQTIYRRTAAHPQK